MYHDICSLIKFILNKSKTSISFQNYIYENHNISMAMSSSSRADTDSVLAGHI